MALIKCKECGKQVSDKAKTCPHCGAKLHKSHIIGKAILVLLFIAYLVYLYYGLRRHEFGIDNAFFYNPLNYQTEKRQFIEDEVKDWLNGRKDIQESHVCCLSVDLVKEASGMYSGVAEFDNGEKTDVEVRVDGDSYLFNAKLPPSVVREKVEEEFEKIWDDYEKRFEKTLKEQLEDSM